MGGHWVLMHGLPGELVLTARVPGIHFGALVLVLKNRPIEDVCVSLFELILIALAACIIGIFADAQIHWQDVSDSSIVISQPLSCVHRASDQLHILCIWQPGSGN